MKACNVLGWYYYPLSVVFFSNPANFHDGVSGHIMVSIPNCRNLWFFVGKPKLSKVPSLKLTWPLKMDGWNTSSLLGWPVFRGRKSVSFRECNERNLQQLQTPPAFGGVCQSFRWLSSPQRRLNCLGFRSNDWRSTQEQTIFGVGGDGEDDGLWIFDIWCIYIYMVFDGISWYQYCGSIHEVWYQVFFCRDLWDIWCTKEDPWEFKTCSLKMDWCHYSVWRCHGHGICF